MFFREDKKSTFYWPWQVPSVCIGSGLDAQSFHVVQFTFRPPSHHSMSAAEKRQTLIPSLINNSVASSGVWARHLIRSRAAMIFCLITSLITLTSPFPVPQIFRYLHASSKFITWRVSPLITTGNNGAGSCVYITNKHVFFTLIYIPHHTAVNSCTFFFGFGSAY